jgi:putative transposase
VTIVREGAHWYASILMRVRRAAPAPYPVAADGVTGIDRGVAHAVVTSNGDVLDMPAATPRQIERERRLARAVSRKRRGSSNRRKAVLALRRHRAKLARRRRDRMHKITHGIVKDRAQNHGAVIIEKLRVGAMTASVRGTAEAPGRNVRQKSGLNRRILESGWGEMRRQLDYKLRRAGGRLIEVPARHTSQTCPACGTVDPASRTAQAVFHCTGCGHEAHADVNAAVEIRRRGLLALGLTDEGSLSSVSTTPAGTVGAARGALCAGMATKREEQKIDVSAMPRETAA